jgi:hypothetical protein
MGWRVSLGDMDDESGFITQNGYGCPVTDVI